MSRILLISSGFLIGIWLSFTLFFLSSLHPNLSLLSLFIAVLILGALALSLFLDDPIAQWFKVEVSVLHSVSIAAVISLILGVLLWFLG